MVEEFIIRQAVHEDFQIIEIGFWIFLEITFNLLARKGFIEER